jgi:hypothetical protein
MGVRVAVEVSISARGASSSSPPSEPRKCHRRRGKFASATTIAHSLSLDNLLRSRCSISADSSCVSGVVTVAGQHDLLRSIQGVRAAPGRR